MDRRTYYPYQPIGPVDMTGVEDSIELAIGRIASDLLVAGGGVVSGLVPSQQASPDMTVAVSAGVAYDGSFPPRRVYFAGPGPANVSLALDRLGAATLPASGQYRWVTLTAKQTRNNYDARPQPPDENGDPVADVLYRSDEASVFEVYAGASAGSSGAAVVPTIPGTNVILGEWLLTSVTTQIIDANRSLSRRNPSSLAGLKIGVKDAVAQLAADTLSNCQVLPTNPPSMSVRVLGGRVNTAGGTKVVTGGNVGPLTAAATTGESKIVLIYVDNSGTLQFVAGSDGVTPTAPSHAIGIPLAHIALPNGTNSINEARITDARPFLGAAGGAGVNPYFDRQVATAAQTVFDLPFAYTVGSHQLEVFLNGELLDPDDYTETSSTRVTLDAGASASDVVIFRALPPVVASVVGQHAAQHARGGSDPIDYSAINGLVSGGWWRTTATDIIIGSICAVVGGRFYANAGATTLDAEDALAPAGTLLNSTWYYLYGFGVSDGTLDFEVSTVVPDSGNRLKSTDATRAYLGALRTNADGDVLVAVRHGRSTTYQTGNVNFDGTVFDELGVLVEGPGNLYSLAEYVPPTSRLARLFVSPPVANIEAGVGPTRVSISTPGAGGLPDGHGYHFYFGPPKGGFYRAVATAAQTVFNLPFSYVPGAHQLEVVKNGVVLDLATAYAETDADTVTLAAGATLSDVLIFRAIPTAGAPQATPATLELLLDSAQRIFAYSEGTGTYRRYRVVVTGYTE